MKQASNPLYGDRPQEGAPREPLALELLRATDHLHPLGPGPQAGDHARESLGAERLWPLISGPLDPDNPNGDAVVLDLIELPLGKREFVVTHFGPETEITYRGQSLTRALVDANLRLGDRTNPNGEPAPSPFTLTALKRKIARYADENAGLD